MAKGIILSYQRVGGFVDHSCCMSIWQLAPAAELMLYTFLQDEEAEIADQQAEPSCHMDMRQELSTKPPTRWYDKPKVVLVSRQLHPKQGFVQVLTIVASPSLLHPRLGEAIPGGGLHVKQGRWGGCRRWVRNTRHKAVKVFHLFHLIQICPAVHVTGVCLPDADSIARTRTHASCKAPEVKAHVMVAERLVVKRPGSAGSMGPAW